MHPNRMQEIVKNSPIIVHGKSYRVQHYFFLRNAKSLCSFSFARPQKRSCKLNKSLKLQQFASHLFMASSYVVLLCSFSSYLNGPHFVSSKQFQLHHYFSLQMLRFSTMSLCLLSQSVFWPVTSTRHSPNSCSICCPIFPDFFAINNSKCFVVIANVSS